MLAPGYFQNYTLLSLFKLEIVLIVILPLESGRCSIHPFFLFYASRQISDSVYYFFFFSFCVLLRVLLRYSWVGVVMIFLNFRLMYEYDYGLT